jgi:hypothetical protein
MTLRLNGATSGFTEIDSPAIGGSNTLLLPGSNGSAYQFLRNGATAGTTEFAGSITSGTAVASTSGTSIDFTGIPSYVKRVTVMFQGVSTNGTSVPRFQLGDAGGVENTGYEGYSVRQGASSNAYSAAFSAGFDFNDASTAALVRTGELRLTLLTGNQWVVAGIYTAIGTTAYQTTMAGSKTLSDTLDRIRITTVGGINTFDAGSINILYEG